jgi:hypothetical protein
MYSRLSSLHTMLQTSNIVCRSVCLTDELQIGLEFNPHDGLLNIFVKTAGDHMDVPNRIDVHSNRFDPCKSTWYHDKDYSCSSDSQSGLSIDRSMNNHVYNCFIFKM